MTKITDLVNQKLSSSNVGDAISLNKVSSPTDETQDRILTTGYSILSLGGAGTASTKDYEEGTWPATITQQGFSIAPNSISGRYKVLGNIVFGDVILGFSSPVSAPANNCIISNLPFPVSIGSKQGGYGTGSASGGEIYCSSTSLTLIKSLAPSGTSNTWIASFIYFK